MVINIHAIIKEFKKYPMNKGINEIISTSTYQHIDRNNQMDAYLAIRFWCALAY